MDFVDRISFLHYKFPYKLWMIINESTSDAIKWTDDGLSIVINEELFEKEYLRLNLKYFKTDNVDSFFRQLQLYGFRKVREFNKSLRDKEDHEFQNKNFVRGKMELLEYIRRAVSKGRKTNLKNIKSTSEPVKADPIVMCPKVEIKKEKDYFQNSTEEYVSKEGQINGLEFSHPHSSKKTSLSDFGYARFKKPKTNPKVIVIHNSTDPYHVSETSDFVLSCQPGAPRISDVMKPNFNSGDLFYLYEDLNLTVYSDCE